MLRRQVAAEGTHISGIVDMLKAALIMSMLSCISWQSLDTGGGAWHLGAFHAASAALGCGRQIATHGALSHARCPPLTGLSALTP